MELTIVEAISEVLKTAEKPVTPQEVHDAIVTRGLYQFKAADPVHVVKQQLRRHANGLVFPSASATKYFALTQDGTYRLLPAPVRIKNTALHVPGVPKKKPTATTSYERLMSLHASYITDARSSVLHELKRLSPTAFEHFALRLLKAYGFTRLKVTPPSKDGGIDGFGQLRVGLADLRVAFQCKRFTKGAIGAPLIQQFRGAIQGRAQQGVFFTTAHFTKDAVEESFRSEALPVVLFDGSAIVDIMFEKEGLGVEMEPLSVPRLYLDDVLQPPDSE
jgi:restriction system protein